MKTLTFYIFIILYGFFVTACSFDNQRQIDLEYPITFEIINLSPESITVKSIYNAVDTTAGFVFNGDTIPSGQSFKLKISESSLKAISSGKYFIEGSCEGNPNWLVNGKQLKNLVVQNKNEWKIITKIERCTN